MRSSGLSQVLFALLVFAAAPAAADHYLFEDVETIDAEAQERYAQAGIHGTMELRASGRSAEARAGLAAQVGLPVALVEAHVRLADFLELPSVGPVVAELFVAAGIAGLRDLAQRDAEALAEHLAEVNTRTRIAPITPGVNSLQTWIEAAAGVEDAVMW